MNNTIYRQDAIDAISTWDKFGVDERNRVVRWYEGLEPYVKLRDVVWAIVKLPSAERKGKWVLTDGYRCSRCNYKLQTTGIPMYCPNCGADMRGEEHD